METATVLADRTGDVGSRIEDRAVCLETRGRSPLGQLTRYRRVRGYPALDSAHGKDRPRQQGDRGITDDRV